jgi:5-methylthioribose kinase
MELTPENAREYLRRRGVLDEDQATAATAEPLGGGVSNRVVRVEYPGGCLVVKQPRADLAVEADWPADVDRVHNEAAAARAYAAVLADARLEARVPAVRDEDRDEHVVSFACAPGEATWKEQLLAGAVDRSVARTLGRVLGTVHANAAGDADLRADFDSIRPFEQLRLDPYHRATAERHPDVADEIEAELKRVRATRRTLVHGDYSPKNVLVGDPVWIIDFEVAHWGDPAFDVAFMASHLCIKSVYNGHRREAYLDALDAFRTAYREAVDWSVEPDAIRELAVLVLARVDGKSPVEYVEEGSTAETLRRIATRALREDATTFAGFTGILREETA